MSDIFPKQIVRDVAVMCDCGHGLGRHSIHFPGFCMEEGCKCRIYRPLYLANDYWVRDACG